jgi:hypothetical protein
MNRIIVFFISFSCLFGFLFHIDASTTLLNQKKGIWQDQKETQIEFLKFEKINFNFDEVPLKKVIKVLIHKDYIYILENHRNRLYVIDKKGKYIRTIGRPGQGPGDFEYPRDMFISNDDKIYVLNSLPRRIETFSLDGVALGSIKLDSLEDPAFPHSLLVLKDKSFIISAPHDLLVSIYDSIGDFQKPILKRDPPLDYNKAILGKSAQLSFGSDRTILHFDIFTGVFNKISISGNIKVKFSAYNEFIYKKVKTTDNEFKKKKATRHTMIFTYWSNFCVDYLDNIYVIPFSITKNECQPLYAFSPNGRFLYSKELAFFKRKHLINIACDEENFVFRTRELDLYIANYRRKK